MEKRNLVLMTSVALIVVMAVSVVAFNWPWQTTGDASSKTTYYLYWNKINKINVGGERYTLQLYEMNKNSTSVRITVNDKTSPSLIKEQTANVGGLEIEVKEIFYNSKKPRKSYVSFTARKSESKCVPEINNQKKCTLYVGGEVENYGVIYKIAEIDKEVEQRVKLEVVGKTPWIRINNGYPGGILIREVSSSEGKVIFTIDLNTNQQ